MINNETYKYVDMIRREESNNNLVISFTNVKRLNILNREIIRKELNNSLRNNYINTILDLRGVEFIDSSVFRLLLEYERLADVKGKKLYLRNVSDEVKELIHLLHLENVLEHGIAA